MKRLGVNIDHVATLRNARGEEHPDPFFAAKFVKKSGADSITIHLREDRRHIKDLDAKNICSIKKLLVNLEISIKDEIVRNALKIKPDFICKAFFTILEFVEISKLTRSFLIAHICFASKSLICLLSSLKCIVTESAPY